MPGTIKSLTAALLLGPLLAVAAPFGPNSKAEEPRAAAPLTVHTASGTVHGGINESVPLVRHFLGIPFAQPIYGENRFALPQPLPSNSSKQELDGTGFGPNCPQYEATTPSVYTKVRREYFIQGDNGDDCLTVSIWAPLHPTEDKLPVVVWFYGGGYTTGGSTVPYQNPQKWVERTQAHIVVSIQYRLNFMGFPNSPLSNDGLNFFDARMGVEWTRDNIAAFGGDPTRMVAWGQSAGAFVVGALSLGWPNDPILTGFIEDSGYAYGVFSNYTDTTFQNFTFIAEKFGCTGDAKNMTKCLGEVPQADIESFIQYWVDADRSPALSFQYKPDGVHTFRNNTATYLSGHYAKVPKILGHCLMDGASLAPLSSPPPNIQGPTPAEELALTLFLRCGVVGEAEVRESLGLTSYRFMYSGNFSNISPLPWMGAYHSSELPMIFGTYGDVGGPGTEFQKQTSEVMQDFWLAFARDPENGLSSMGWPKYSSGDIEILGGTKDGQDVTHYATPKGPIENVCIQYNIEHNG